MLDATTNIPALSSQRYLNNNTSALTNTLGKIASGSNFVTAAENPSGLAIATALQTEVTQNAATNSLGQTALSQLSTATSQLRSLSDILANMQQLAVQARAPGANPTTINEQYQHLAASFDQLAANAGFNGGASAFNLGPKSSVNLVMPNISASGLGLSGNLTGTNSVTPETIQAAQNSVNLAIGRLAATANQISGGVQAQQAATINAEAAQSAIAATEIGAAATARASETTLSEAAIAAEAQSNKMAEEAKQLLK
jgi:flagellin